jgi:hypothetical protein
LVGVTKQSKVMYISSSYTREALDRLGMSNYEYFQAESKDDKLFNWLDLYAGVDWIIKDEKNCLYTVASRIRFVRPESKTIYKDFTIRGELYSNIKSEYMKRIESINNGSLYPNYTIQAWYSSSIFKCGAIIETKHLYDFMKKQPQLVSTRWSNRPFYVVGWYDIQIADYPIKIVSESLTRI